MSTVTGWRKRQIDDEIHSCSPFCDKPMCVAEAVQAEREAILRLSVLHGAPWHFRQAIRARGEQA